MTIKAKIRATVDFTFTVRDATGADAEGRAYEILDPEGEHMGWADTLSDAATYIADVLHERASPSSVDVEVYSVAETTAEHDEQR